MLANVNIDITDTCHSGGLSFQEESCDRKQKAAHYVCDVKCLLNVTVLSRMENESTDKSEMHNKARTPSFIKPESHKHLLAPPFNICV